MVHDVLAGQAWADRLTTEDRRGLTPLSWDLMSGPAAPTEYFPAPLKAATARTSADLARRPKDRGDKPGRSTSLRPMRPAYRSAVPRSRSRR